MKEDLEEEIFQARKYLSTNGDNSVYNKISSIISTVLDERPSRAIDQIERYMSDAQTRQEKQDTQRQQNFAETQIKLFDVSPSLKLSAADAEVQQNSRRRVIPIEKLLDIKETALHPYCLLHPESVSDYSNKSNEEELGDGMTENEDEFEIPLPNCAKMNFYFEQAGIGLGCEETYRIFLALKQLVFSHPLSSIRFWGKMFGVESNYVIAEAEYRDGEGDDEEENLEKIKILLNMLKGRDKSKHVKCKRCDHCGLRKRQMRMRANTVPSTAAAEDEEETQDQMSDNEDEGPTEEDSIPKSTWKPPPLVPKEDHRTGVNKKVYFVCNEPGEQWVKLPHVTPAEINAARGITKLLTGRLDAKVESYPPFPGNELNYLRAQIARISASTQISPASYFIFDDEEEEDDEEEVRDSYMLNEDYEGISLKELTEASMMSWVHHTQHILPQGRCQWLNPSEKPEDDFEEEEYDEDEDGESSNNVMPESGPTLLSSVAGDSAIGNIPAWSTYMSSRVLPEYAIAVARSNRWPGAYAFATPRLFDNIYIGWGNKYTLSCYNPPAPPPAFEEFPETEEMRELDDPTVEEERALKEREDEALRAAEEIDDLDEDDEDDD